MMYPALAPPARFIDLLALYHLLPLHFPLTTWITDAPFGRFGKPGGWGGSWLWMNGNVAWAAMEIVAPLTLLYNMVQAPQPLSSRSLILAGCYLTHYFHRAIISPLVLSPKRSPIHLIVPLLAASYNLLNAYSLANGLIHYPAHLEETSTSKIAFSVAFAGWALGFLGNVYHDEVLNDLRRPAGSRLVSSERAEEKEDKKKSSNGRYAIPRGGLYELVSYPNYLCEWFEWTCLALVAAPQILITIPATVGYDPIFGFLETVWRPQTLLHPSWIFVIFELASMLPRAVRGHKWYQQTFGDRYPSNRKVAFPYIF